MLLLLLFTPYGRNVCGFVIYHVICPAIGFFIPSFLRDNRRLDLLADKQLQAERESRNEIRQQMLAEAAEGIFSQSNAGISGNISLRDISSGAIQIRLMLRTKAFMKSATRETQGDNDSPSEAVNCCESASCNSSCDSHEIISDGTCSICLSDIEEGELIGDLPCHHAFHVDCLKTWIPRKNSCPMCLHNNIAYVKSKRRAHYKDKADQACDDEEAQMKLTHPHVHS